MESIGRPFGTETHLNGVCIPDPTLPTTDSVAGNAIVYVKEYTDMFGANRFQASPKLVPKNTRSNGCFLGDDGWEVQATCGSTNTTRGNLSTVFEVGCDGTKQYGNSIIIGNITVIDGALNFNGSNITYSGRIASNHRADDYVSGEQYHELSAGFYGSVERPVHYSEVRIQASIKKLPSYSEDVLHRVDVDGTRGLRYHSVDGYYTNGDSAVMTGVVPLNANTSQQIVMGLNVIAYNYTGDYATLLPGQRVGIDVNSALTNMPQMVKTSTNGIGNSENYIDNSQLVPVLLQQVQELIKLVSIQRSQLQYMASNFNVTLPSA